MKRIYIGPNNCYQYQRGIKKRICKEMQCVNIVNSKNIQRQRYNYLSKIGFYIRKAIMIILLIFILFLILQQNQVWYVK